jgi:hypothetical protein
MGGADDKFCCNEVIIIRHIWSAVVKVYCHTFVSLLMTQLKSRAYNVPACIRFIDTENAFDGVDRSEFCDIVIDRGFCRYLTGSKRTLYSHTHTQMLISKRRVRDDSCDTYSLLQNRLFNEAVLYHTLYLQISYF